MPQTEKFPAMPVEDPRLNTVRRISRLLDEEFEIFGFRFGLDPLLGMLPVAGDIGSYVISIALILTMLKHGVSGKVVMKMVGNVTLDALIGTIPVLGWIFDFAFKANKRNLRLLNNHYAYGKDEGGAIPYILWILGIMLLVLVLIVYLTIRFFGWLSQYLQPL